MAELPNHDASLTETCLESKTIHQGPFLTLKCDTVSLPDGKQATREYVQHPGAVMVIPLFDDGRVLLESQYRYPMGKVMVEYPAGKLDPNEGALACAKRELQEETGYTAREYVYLTRIHPIISYSTEFIDIYRRNHRDTERQHGRRTDTRTLFVPNMPLGRVPTRAAVFFRPRDDRPAARAEQLVPACEVFAVQTLVVEYFVAQLARQIRFEPGADVGAERVVSGGIVQIHA